VRSAAETQLIQSHREGLGFGEAGGWALAEQLRGTTAALQMVLATYSLAQLLGDAFVISTATLRNGSATILRRIGGRGLSASDAELPVYYDPLYKCEMQLLRFDSRCPNPKYEERVEAVRNQLLTVPVICNRRPATDALPMLVAARAAAVNRRFSSGLQAAAAVA